MPIKQLDENRILPGMGLPTLGSIRKGDPKPSDNRPGPDLDYLRFEAAEGFESLNTLFAQVYGQQPKEIGPLFFFGESPDEVFPHWNEWWMESKQGGEPLLLIRCDGETIVKRYERDSKAHAFDPVACIKDDAEKGCKCRQTGRLSFALPDLEIASGHIGVYHLRTTSTHDIINIYGALKAIYQRFCLSQFGFPLSNIPFTLMRKPAMIPTPQPDGTFKPRKKHMLSLMVHPIFVKRLPELMELSNIAKRVADGMGNNNPALPDGKSNDDELPAEPSYVSEVNQFFTDYTIDLELADFCHHVGTTINEVQGIYPTGREIGQAILDWIAENGLLVLARGVMGKRKGNGWNYGLNCGFGIVWAWSREAFNEVGYDTSLWQTEEEIRFESDEAIPLIISREPGKGYFQVKEVHGTL